MGAKGQAPKARPWLPWLIPVAAAWVWFCTVATQSQAQILALENVENYALAVFTQLFWMFSETGSWAQTIHFGYVDSWMWSGHRSGWLPVIGWLYGLDPDPVWLCRMQVAVVALGALPAFGLGRLAIGGTWGGITGLVLYLGYPPLAAMALQDYQDLVLGIPLLLLVLWQSRRKAPIAFAVAALATCMVREELIPMVVVAAFSVPGSFRQRMSWVMRAGFVAALYGGVIWYLGRGFEGYANPMMSHSGDMVLQWPPVLNRTMEDVHNFYLAFLKPVHFLALLEPVTLLPAGAALFFHVTAPAHGGVDTTWQGHIHHMAPVVAFVVAATIEGVGRLVRLSPRLGKFQKPLVSAGAAIGLFATVQLMLPWMQYLSLSPQLYIGAPDEEHIAPEWALVAEIPADAAVATDTYASLLITNRREAYTYDESLRDKRPGEGLDALDYILIRKSDSEWLDLARSVPTAREVGETDKYILLHLRAES